MRKAVAALLLPIALAANGFTCEDLCGFGRLEVGAGLIALRPSTWSLGYAIEDAGVTSLPQGTMRTLHPELEIGLRASIGYGARGGCIDARVEYTYLHSRDLNGSRSDGTLWQVLIHPTPFSPLTNIPIPADIHIRSKFDYDGVDLQLATRYMRGRCLHLRSYCGAHYVNLDHKLAQDIEGGTPDHFELSQFWSDRRCSWGIGPLFGTDFNWRFHRSLGITGRIDVALVSGVTRWKRVELTEIPSLFIDERLDVAANHIPHLTPYFRASIGAIYCVYVPWAYQLTVEASYEFRSYLEGLNLFRFNDERATGSNYCLPFNLDGPVLMVRLVI
ncbi:MAG: Lpg1974 family pore-forming outer membrane protein [Parachlamydiales bacterium]